MAYPDSMCSMIIILFHQFTSGLTRTNTTQKSHGGSSWVGAKASNIRCGPSGSSILFSQYRSCDDAQESILFQSWTFFMLNVRFLGIVT